MGSWLPLLVFLLVGGGVTTYLFAIRFRAEERVAGLRALTDMHWREFHRLVVAAIERRGYHPIGGAPAPGSDESLVELRKGDERWLLETRHGQRSVLGHNVLTSFANTIRLSGAHGGLLTTPGAVPDALVPQAQLNRIELLDGRTLWSDIRPFLEPQQRDAIASPVRQRATRHAVIGWLAAALVAVVVWIALPRPADGDGTDGTTRRVARSAPGVGTTSTAAAAAAAPSIPGSGNDVRMALAKEVGTIAWIEQATWSTASTLLVQVGADDGVDKAELCAVIDRYIDLRASRVQVQPAPGSDRPVRFFQCSSY